MADKLRSVPTLRDVFGSNHDTQYTKLWRDFAKTMVEWDSFRNYDEAMRHFCVAFDVAKRLYGSENALAVYQAVTEDVRMKPDEVLQAAKYLSDGGDKTVITELASESYFLDYDHSREMDVDFHLADYKAPERTRGSYFHDGR